MIVTFHVKQLTIKKVRLTMKKKRLTIEQVFKITHNNAQEEYNIPLLNVTVPNNSEWYNAYKEQYQYIDDYVNTFFSDFVLDNFSYVEDTIPTAPLQTFLKRKSNLFFMLKKLTYDKLWEIESITFNPINNYDSHKKSTMTRTGSESDRANKEFEKVVTNTKTGSFSDTLTKSGSETLATKNNQTIKVDNTSDGSTDIATKNNQTTTETTKNNQSMTETTKNNQSMTETTKNNQTETVLHALATENNVATKNNQSSTTTTKNNQSYKDTHTLTAYANNEVNATTRTYEVGNGDTVVTDFTGDADTVKSTNTGTNTDTTTYTGEGDTKKTEYDGDGDTRTTEYTGDGDTKTTAYSGNADTVNTTDTIHAVNTTTYTGDADTTEQSFNNRKDSRITNYDNLKDITNEGVTKDTAERTKTYNSVTDTFEETHSGNIGVTTSTAMLSEFVDFYGHYSFFEHLISDFVQFICRVDFETEVE